MTLDPAARIEPNQIRFEGDDGSLDFAKAAGIYTAGLEAPVFPEGAVPREAVAGAKSLTMLAFGHSNAANRRGPLYAAYVFNVFDMRFYRAIDPLPGASNDGAAVWGRLADNLIAARRYDSVIVAPIAVGGSYVRDWAPGGLCNHRLAFALHRLKMGRIALDALCWHQGEAEANLTDMPAFEYQRHFRAMQETVRRAGVAARVYVAAASLCATADHPFKNRAQARLAHQRLVAPPRRIWPGPDTDRIGVAHRIDSCHFSRSGLERHAEAWFEALTRSAAARWRVWAGYRLSALPPRNAMSAR